MWWISRAREESITVLHLLCCGVYASASIADVSIRLDPHNKFGLCLLLAH